MAQQPQTKSFTIYTVEDEPLSKPVQLLFVIAPTVDGRPTKSFTPLAWEVVSFGPKVTTTKTITWTPGRRMSLFIGDRVTQDRVSAEIEPGSYVELQQRNAWATHPFFDGDDNKIIAINNSPDDAQFILGSMSKADDKTEFQPFGLLRKLKKKEGLATEVPHFIQVYSVVQYRRHQKISEDLTRREALLAVDFNVPSLDVRLLPERTYLRLRMTPEGKLSLGGPIPETIKASPSVQEVATPGDKQTTSPASSQKPLPPLVVAKPTIFVPNDASNDADDKQPPPPTDKELSPASIVSKLSAKKPPPPLIGPKPNRSGQKPAREENATRQNGGETGEDMGDKDTGDVSTRPTGEQPPIMPLSPPLSDVELASPAGRQSPQALKALGKQPSTSSSKADPTSGEPTKPDDKLKNDDGKVILDSSRTAASQNSRPVTQLPTPSNGSRTLTPPPTSDNNVVAEPDPIVSQPVNHQASPVLQAAGSPSTTPAEIVPPTEPNKPTNPGLLDDELSRTDSDRDSDGDSASESDESSDDGSEIDTDSNAAVAEPPVVGAPVKTETVDLVPLRDALRLVADLIDKQIPFGNVPWGKQVLAQFGPNIMPLLASFKEDAPTWEGFKK